MSTVYLVGAGPGDPKLLTRRAYELITSAEIVVYDALVSPRVIELIPPTTRLYNVGKRYGAHSMKQPRSMLCSSSWLLKGQARSYVSRAAIPLSSPTEERR